MTDGPIEWGRFPHQWYAWLERLGRRRRLWLWNDGVPTGQSCWIESIDFGAMEALEDGTLRVGEMILSGDCPSNFAVRKVQS